MGLVVVWFIWVFLTNYRISSLEARTLDIETVLKDAWKEDKRHSQ
jgi:hypothetical protein